MGGLWIPAEAAWPLAFLVVAALWAVAISQIGAGLRQGSSPITPLAMTVAVSAVAVLAVLAAGAALSGGGSAADAGTGCGAVRATPVFGFGIEEASRVDDGCTRGGTRY